MAGIRDFMSSPGETYNAGSNVVNLGGFTKDRVPKTNTMYTNSAGYTGGVSTFDPATDPAMKGYGSPVNENAQSKPTTQVNRALDKGLINKSAFTTREPFKGMDPIGLGNANAPPSFNKGPSTVVNQFGANASPPAIKSVNQFGAAPSVERIEKAQIQGPTPAGNPYRGSQNTNYSGKAGEKIRVGSQQTTGRATMEAPTDKANYTDTKNYNKIEPNKNVAIQGAQYEKITPNTGMSVGGSGGSIPPEEPPLVGSGSSFGANGGWKGAVKGSAGGLVGAAVTYAADKAVGAGLDGLSAYSSKNDKGASPAANAVGDIAESAQTGRTIRDLALSGATGLISDKLLGNAFTRKDQLKPDQVLAAPSGSKEEAKLQDGLGAAKLKAEQERMQLSAADPHGAKGAGEGGVATNATIGNNPTWSQAASENPASPFYGKSDHSGDAAAKLKYTEQQALLGNKDASFGHEGTTPEGLVKKGWTQDPDKMVDGWAKSAAVNPEGVVPKPEESSSKEIQHYRDVMNKEPEGSDIYKAAEKSLTKAQATWDHHNPKEVQGSKAAPSLMSTAGEEVPGKYLKTEEGNNTTAYRDNPAYQAYRARGNGMSDTRVDGNPVSLMTIGEKGEHIYSENPNHTDINTGRTRVQEYQYQHDPQRKVEQHMDRLVSQAAHEEFMSDDTTRSGLIHMQRATRLGDEINALNNSMGDERKSRYQTDGLVKSNIHKDDTDAGNNMRTNIQSGLNQSRASEAAEYGDDKKYGSTVRGQDRDFETKQADRTSAEKVAEASNTSLENRTKMTVDGETNKNYWSQTIADKKERASAERANIANVNHLASQAAGSLDKFDKEDANTITGGMAGAMDYSGMAQPEFNTHFVEAKRQHDILKNSGGVMTSKGSWFGYQPLLTGASPEKVEEFNRMPPEERRSTVEAYKDRQKADAERRSRVGGLV